MARPRLGPRGEKLAGEPTGVRFQIASRGSAMFELAPECRPLIAFASRQSGRRLAGDIPSGLDRDKNVCQIPSIASTVRTMTTATDARDYVRYEPPPPPPPPLPHPSGPLARRDRPTHFRDRYCGGSSINSTGHSAPQVMRPFS